MQVPGLRATLSAAAPVRGRVGPGRDLRRKSAPGRPGTCNNCERGPRRPTTVRVAGRYCAMTPVHRLRRLALLLLLSLPPLLARAGTQDLVRTDQGHVGTRVSLAGHGERMFVVDTGASTSAIYQHARRELGLEAEPAQRLRLHGAGGTQLVERYRLPALGLAGIEADGLVVAGLPAGVKHGDGISGVLGQDVLRRYAVEFDFKAGRLGLHARGHAPASRAGWQEVPIRLLPQVGLVVVDVSIGGRVVGAVLDTGAPRSFINWSAARAVGVTPDTRGLARGNGAGGATAHRFDYATFAFDRVALGPARPGRARLSIADLPVFPLLGMGERPGMILGIDLLGDKRFVIDHARRRLLIER